MAENADLNAASDLMALIGTTLLWVHWPSFVGATKMTTFCLGQTPCHRKFDPVHIANSTLARGAVVGSSAQLAMTPGGVLALEIMAGLVSICGCVHSMPCLASMLKACAQQMAMRILPEACQHCHCHCHQTPQVHSEQFVCCSWQRQFGTQNHDIDGTRIKQISQDVIASASLTAAGFVGCRLQQMD